MCVLCVQHVLQGIVCISDANAQSEHKHARTTRREKAKVQKCLAPHVLLDITNRRNTINEYHSGEIHLDTVQ